MCPELSPEVKGSLRDSLRVMRERPQFFLPKTASSVLGSLFIVGMLEGYGSILFYLLVFPLLVFEGLFVSVWLAGSVLEESLADGFRKALDSALSIAAVSALIAFFIFCITVPASVGVALYLAGGPYLLAVSGIAFSTVLFLAATVYSYFLPVTLLEGGALSAVKASVKSSSRRRSEVLLLTAMSIVLLGLAYGASGSLEKLGYAGFTAARLISAALNTYVFIVSPEFYSRLSSSEA